MSPHGAENITRCHGTYGACHNSVYKSVCKKKTYERSEKNDLCSSGFISAPSSVWRYLWRPLLSLSLSLFLAHCLLTVSLPPSLPPSLSLFSLSFFSLPLSLSPSLSLSHTPSLAPSFHGLHPRFSFLPVAGQTTLVATDFPGSSRVTVGHAADTHLLSPHQANTQTATWQQFRAAARLGLDPWSLRVTFQFASTVVSCGFCPHIFLHGERGNARLYTHAQFAFLVCLSCCSSLRC